ncbi:MAG: T9SS type A sorting domain-containing protein, partial [Candidatus Cloacimonetes bacterium]|nr:T9SS type A sorting domain-containing protein [Candidatus Cloacimonadota bacterium]
TCYSIGNYVEREYYHIITNSNGDSLITEEDADEIFNSADFPDGDYYFKVTVRDASMNVTVDSMLVTFNNGVSTEEDEVPNTKINLSNYPNSFNPETTIQFTIENAKNAKIIIYNMKGQKVKEILIVTPSPTHTFSIIWNGNDDNNQPVSSGVYLYKLKSGNKEIVNKMLLLK